MTSICVLINSHVVDRFFCLMHCVTDSTASVCVAVLSAKRWRHRPVWRLHQNSDRSDWMLGSLPSSLSCSASWELSGSRQRPRGQLRETPAWPELRAQMVWKCVWVFSLAKHCVCESRCYSDCTKASECLITQRERWRKERILRYSTVTYCLGILSRYTAGEFKGLNFGLG